MLEGFIRVVLPAFFVSILESKRSPFGERFLNNAGFILPLRIASDTIL